MDPILPIGFTSWTQVLIDWGVSRAFSAADLPRCFKDRPDLAAPFVAEIGAAIRDKQLICRASEASLIAQQVTEPNYDLAGGTDYREVRFAMEKAQERFFAAWRLLGADDADEHTPELAALRAEMERHQADFERIRRRHEPRVHAARQAAVRAYWSNRPLRGIPDTFFADAAPHTAPARMQRIHPPWWGAFLDRLQQPLAHGHPAEGHLLDELPNLRAAATKKTLAGLIAEWRAKHNDRWGWYGNVHDRMLARRAAGKAEWLTRWFNERAPDYLASVEMQYSLHMELAERLTEADPWAVSPPERSPFAYWSEHWRN